ncbi:hypothetical protein APED_00700 [Acanthopleuribacter pedis]
MDGASSSEAVIKRQISECAHRYEARRREMSEPRGDRALQAREEAQIEILVHQLVQSDGPVLRVVRRLESADDAGTLFVVLRVLAERGFFEEVMGLAVSLSATPLAGAIADALVLSWPKEETAYVRSLLRHRNGLVIAVIAQLIGTKRLPLGEAMQHALEKEHREPAHAWLGWALGRVPHPPALPLLFDKLKREQDPQAATLIATALLRNGHQPTLDHCRERLEHESWPRQLCAIAGDAADATRLVAALKTVTVGPDDVLAAGLAGDRAAVPFLLDHLDTDSGASYRDSGASHRVSGASHRTLVTTALYLLTGAPLFHADSPKPKTAWAEDATAWRQWWQQQGSEFRAGTRYRLGRAVDPAVLLDQMASEWLPRALRQVAYEEYVIRYQLDGPFEAHLYVARQQETLSAMRAALAERETPFTPGAFYFKGALLPA